MVDEATHVELVEGSLTEPDQELPGILENPNDGAFLARQRATSPERLERALAAAADAWEGGWSEVPLAERGSLLHAFADALEPRAAEIAELDSLDSGVPITVTTMIADSLGAGVRGATEQALAAGDRESLDEGGRRIELLRLPWGPALLLTPWNAPAAAAVGKLANALAAGCPAILKPSEQAPSSARVLAEAALAAGLPAGALQVVHGDAGVARQLVTDPRVRVVALTGGQTTGRAVAAATAPRMVALQLELGGSNPALVADDADLAAAARALAAGTTKLNGQWCEAPRRVLVAASRHDDLVDALRAELGSIRVGPTFAADTEVGPLAHRGHRDRVRAQVGALAGEAIETAPVPGGDGFFLSPTLVLGAEPQLPVEEIFGPVLLVQPVADDREALRLANGNGDGLAAYLFSADPERAFALGRRLHAGEVRIGGTNLIDLAAGSSQSFWGSSGIGGHGRSRVFEAFRGSRIVGEENPALPI